MLIFLFLTSVVLAQCSYIRYRHSPPSPSSIFPLLYDVFYLTYTFFFTQKKC